MSTPDNEPVFVTELTGKEGGTWRVVTRDSNHYFDLDFGTVTRVRGANAGPTINDRTRPLRTIDGLRVGERGRWTMLTDGWSETSTTTGLTPRSWHGSKSSAVKTFQEQAKSCLTSRPGCNAGVVPSGLSDPRVAVTIADAGPSR